MVEKVVSSRGQEPDRGQRPEDRGQGGGLGYCHFLQEPEIMGAEVPTAGSPSEANEKNDEKAEDRPRAGLRRQGCGGD